MKAVVGVLLITGICMAKGSVEVPLGYSGMFSDGASFHGGSIGVGKILKDHIYFNTIGVECSYIGSKTHLQENTYLFVDMFNPVVYYGTDMIKLSFGALGIKSSTDGRDVVGTTLDKSWGISTGVRLNVPTSNTLSPYISTSFNRVDNVNMLGLKLGCSLIF